MKRFETKILFEKELQDFSSTGIRIRHEFSNFLKRAGIKKEFLKFIAAITATEVCYVSKYLMQTECIKWTKGKVKDKDGNKIKCKPEAITSFRPSLFGDIASGIMMSQFSETNTIQMLPVYILNHRVCYFQFHDL